MKIDMVIGGGCYEGGWTEWAPMSCLESLFDENRQMKKQLCTGTSVEYVMMILGCIEN